MAPGVPHREPFGAAAVPGLSFPLDGVGKFRQAHPARDGVAVDADPRRRRQGAAVASDDPGGELLPLGERAARAGGFVLRDGIVIVGLPVTARAGGFVLRGGIGVVGRPVTARAGGFDSTFSFLGDGAVMARAGGFVSTLSFLSDGLLMARAGGFALRRREVRGGVVAAVRAVPRGSVRFVTGRNGRAARAGGFVFDI